MPGVPPCSGVFAAYHLLRRPNRADTHAALLGLFAAVLVNAVVTNGIKIMVCGAPKHCTSCTREAACAACRVYGFISPDVRWCFMIRCILCSTAPRAIIKVQRTKSCCQAELRADAIADWVSL